MIDRIKNIAGVIVYVITGALVFWLAFFSFLCACVYIR